MDRQTLFTLFNDPFVIGLAIVFGVGALGTIAALAIAGFIQRRRRSGARSKE
jgi:hypothetical protein